MEDFDFFFITIIILPFLILKGLLILSDQKENKNSIKYILSWNAVFLVFLISLSFAGFETYYRFFVDRTESFDGAVKLTNRWYKRHYTPNNIMLRDNLDYGAIKSPSKKIRISFLGDSFTEGVGIENVEERFVNIIRRRNPDWEIHCLARSAYDTKEEFALINNLGREGYRLDYVILCYVLNDICYLMPEIKMINEEFKTNNENAGFFESNSYFVNTYMNTFRPKYIHHIENFHDFLKDAYEHELWVAQRDSLKRLSNLITNNHGKILAVTFPLFDAPWKDYKFTLVHHKLDSLWKAINTPHLDLLPFYSNFEPKKLVVNKYDAHPNEFADSLAASTIELFIRKNIPKY